MRPYVALGVAVLLVITATACYGAEPTLTPTPGPIPSSTSTPLPTLTSTPTPVQTSTPTPPQILTPVPPPTVYEELLSLIPDTPETRSQVWINDFSRIRETFNIALAPLPGESPFISSYSSLGRPPPFSFRQYLAFDQSNVDQTVLTGLPQSDELEVGQGRFDPKATDETLRACSECQTPLRQVHRGVLFYSWGEDLKTDVNYILALPAYDQLGRGGRISVQENRVLRTLETPGMRSLIDTAAGEHPSLADAVEYRLLAQGMDTLGAYSALLTDLTQGADGFSAAPALLRDAGLKEELEMAPMHRPYLAFATGAGYDKDGPYMALVLIHARAQFAEENAERLRVRIQELPSLFHVPRAQRIDSIEAWVEDVVLLARLRGNIDFGTSDGIGWYSWWWLRIPLILHE